MQVLDASARLMLGLFCSVHFTIFSRKPDPTLLLGCRKNILNITRDIYFRKKTSIFVLTTVSVVQHRYINCFCNKANSRCLFPSALIQSHMLSTSTGGVKCLVLHSLFLQFKVILRLKRMRAAHKYSVLLFSRLPERAQSKVSF